MKILSAFCIFIYLAILSGFLMLIINFVVQKRQEIYILKVDLLPKDIRIGVGRMKLARGLSSSKWSDLRRFCPHGHKILPPCAQIPGSLNTNRGMPLFPSRLQDTQQTCLGRSLHLLRQHQQGKVRTPSAPDKPKRPK